MSNYLLDVNVLIALYDIRHEHHDVVVRWLKEIHYKVAVCPIVENAVFRICTHQKYPNGQSSFSEILSFMTELRKLKNVSFIPDDYSFSNENSIVINIPSQFITDIYLLSIAKKNDMIFATFDRKINKKHLKGFEGIYYCLSV